MRHNCCASQKNCFVVVSSPKQAAHGTMQKSKFKNQASYSNIITSTPPLILKEILGHMQKHSSSTQLGDFVMVISSQILLVWKDHIIYILIRFIYLESVWQQFMTLWSNRKWTAKIDLPNSFVLAFGVSWSFIDSKSSCQTMPLFGTSILINFLTLI